MGDPGEIEHQIAKWRLVLEHRHQRAGIGVPIGKFGKSGREQAPVLFVYGQTRKQGSGIGKRLPESQSGLLGLLVECDQPKPALDLFVKRQRCLEAWINPFEILCRPIG